MPASGCVFPEWKEVLTELISRTIQAVWMAFFRHFPDFPALFLRTTASCKLPADFPPFRGELLEILWRSYTEGRKGDESWKKLNG